MPSGQDQMRLLSERLKAAGTEGAGLRRALYKAIDKASAPLADELRNTGHLMPYMPDRYAPVLAGDLDVTAAKRAGANPSIRIRVRGRDHKRKVVQLNAGVISHPLFGNRKRWYRQTSGVRPGFFSDPAEKAKPAIRDEVIAALHDVAAKITGA